MDHLTDEFIRALKRRACASFDPVTLPATTLEQLCKDALAARAMLRKHRRARLLITRLPSIGINEERYVCPECCDPVCRSDCAWADAMGVER